MSKVAILKEIRAQARRKGLSVREILEDMDEKNDGKLFTIRFRRLFDALGLWFDEDKFSQITSPYMIGERHVDYRKFLSELENLDQTTESVVGVRELSELAMQFRARNTTMSECMRGVDRYHTGCVSLDAYFSVVGNTPLAHRIAEQYVEDPGRDINYIQLERDMERAVTSFAATRGQRKELPSCFRSMVRKMVIRGIDPYPVLAAHDRFRRLVILPAHFLGDMADMGLGLTASEISSLSDAFTDGGMFDYVAFCQACQDAASEYEKARKEEQEKTVAREELKPPVDLPMVLKKIEYEIDNRRLPIMLALEHYDQSCTGRLPISTFKKNIREMGFSIREDEIDAIAQEFRDKDGSVNYKTFVLAVTKPPPKDDHTGENQMGRLKAYLADKRWQLRPLMEKLDSKRTGSITWAQLAFLFRNISFDLSVREARMLRQKIGDLININEFCEQVDPVFKEPEPTQVEEEEEPEVPEQETLNVLGKTASLLQVSQRNFIDALREYHCIPTGHIYAASFREMMHAFPAPMSDDDINQLITKYTDTKKGMVDGFKLARDIGEYGTTQLQLFPELSVTLKTEQNAIQNNSTRAILRRLKAHLDSIGRSLTDLCRPYDCYRGGVISQEDFHAIFLFTRFYITQEEEEALFKAFESQRLPKCVNYRKVLHCMQEETVTDTDLAATKIAVTTTNAGEDDLVSICTALHSKLAARRKSARCVFIGLGEGPIPYQQFQQCVRNYGLVLSAPDLQTICRKYRVNLRGDVDWVAFCNDVDSMKTLQP